MNIYIYIYINNKYKYEYKYIYRERYLYIGTRCCQAAVGSYMLLRSPLGSRQRLHVVEEFVMSRTQTLGVLASTGGVWPKDLAPFPLHTGTLRSARLSTKDHAVVRQSQRCVEDRTAEHRIPAPSSVATTGPAFASPECMCMICLYIYNVYIYILCIQIIGILV